MRCGDRNCPDSRRKSMNNGRWANVAIQGIHLNLDCYAKCRLGTVRAKEQA